MKNLLISLFALIAFGNALGQTTATDYEQATKFLSFNTNSKVFNGSVTPRWINESQFWYQKTTPEGTKYVLVSAENGAKTEYESREEIPGYESAGGRSFSRTEISSPDNKKVAFIRDWNLWVREVESGEEIQLTQDGAKDFGYATDNAGWRKSDRPIILWSPDSKKIATFKQDQRHVSSMYLVTTKVGAPELKEWKYPLPEDGQVIMIQRVIIDTETKKIIPLDVPADPRRGTLCDDISCSGGFDDNQWSADSRQLAFVSTTRDHKTAKFRIADAQTGKVREVFQETVTTQYESGRGVINWKWLPESNEILWYSERDDWGHMYLYDAVSGKLKNQITKGDFVVTQVIHVDQAERTIYFMANGYNKNENPYFSHFYSIDFAGRKFRELTPEEGNHRVSFSYNHPYFVDNYSQPNVPNIAKLKDLKGKTISILEEQDISELKQSGWQPPTPIKVKSRDGRWDLYGLMYTPTNMVEGRKYPVVNYIYPGPQGGSIGYWGFVPSRSDHQALAELGFVVIAIEGTCNPGRSKSFHDVCYGNMADNTLEDQIAGIEQVADKHGFLDLDRVGIWGHSGGGFATAAAMFRYPDFYKVGVSQSGNHDNRNYEDDWGERYIGLLTVDSTGKSNYEDQANQNFAKNLKGKLMLAHGGLDDNVPPYNTYLVVDALIKANKDFDLIVFPNARHGYGRDSYYMMRRRWDYFVEHLQGSSPAPNFIIDPRNR